jgi:hypothetical protein
MCSLMSVLDNFSISKNNIICAEATQGTMVSKLSVNVKPLHTYTTQFIKLALSSLNIFLFLFLKKLNLPLHEVEIILLYTYRNRNTNI